MAATSAAAAARTLLPKEPDLPSTTESLMKEAIITELEKLPTNNLKRGTRELEREAEKRLKIIAELEQRRDVFIHIAKVYEPATEEQIQAAEHVVGAKLHPVIVEFFRHQNGVILQWSTKRCKIYDPKKHIRNDNNIPNVNAFLEHGFNAAVIPMDGVIVIPRIQDIFFQGSYSENFPKDAPLRLDQVFDGRVEVDIYHSPMYAGKPVPKDKIVFHKVEYSDSADLEERVRLIDFFQDHYDTNVVLIVEPNNADPPVVMNGFASLQAEENVLPLSTYLTRRLFSFGILDGEKILDGAYEIYSRGWSVDPADLPCRLDSIMVGTVNRPYTTNT